MSVRPAAENLQTRSTLMDMVDALAARPDAVVSPLSAAAAPVAGAGLCLCLCVAFPTV
ncbi:hypothetical protein [Kineococcus arenarius]|uniref:hypothetical protein n=1 Tax=unclassified Kineococcus TaxID=2621656 RepID=UPI003D7F0961